MTPEQRIAEIDKQITELKSKADNAVFNLFEYYERSVRPLYPWILVKVFPKQRKINGIWTPGSLAEGTGGTQNTVMYEGMVLRTWGPFWKTILVKTEEHSREHGQVVRTETHRVQQMSEVKSGDIIMFPHYEGLPVPYLNETDKDGFRLIREHNPADRRCEAMAVVDYSDNTIEKQLAEELVNTMRCMDNGYDGYTLFSDTDIIQPLVKKLLEKFVICPKDMEMKSTSGK